MQLTKRQKQAMSKLGITHLNPMQEAAHQAITEQNEIVLLSPTGSGKTVAFLLPLLERIDAQVEAVQLLVLAPSRELAIQIETVLRQMATGIKVNAFYGGQHFTKDKLNLKHIPAVLIGTPGRIADHIRRESFSLSKTRLLVIDEYDKSLEIGFEKEMKFITQKLKACKKKILTSATDGISLPGFLEMENATRLDFLHTQKDSITIKHILSPDKDKLPTLIKTLKHLGDQLALVFCNYKDSINRISERLEEEGIPHGRYYGTMEQKDRERALIKFRNGTHRLLITTDLAARGLDIPEIKNIIHYHLPFREEEFVHRNGRTARMNATGTVYVLQWAEEELKPYLQDTEAEILSESQPLAETEWTTLFISGGRKDKISKGDIVGLFIKEGGLSKEELGLIELKQDCAFVAVKSKFSAQLCTQLNNSKIKKRKVRIYEI
jgi:superfamily II DNA/RNA helicase